MTTAHPTLLARLAEVREELAGLLGDVDTRVRPKPSRVVPASEPLPGPVWEPAEKWTVRVVDPDEAPICVFVTHPQIWDDDILPIDPAVSRRIGMAFLAAADWADRVRAREIAPTPKTTEETL
ncbi:hypothetical protein [Streptosporangium jomthongense]|uniref:Uncharacterized protein n=1 Tax=Streptosporangium jomthongense TaxID=1193683 RepID=A0ABV8FCS2_9ACTN